MPAMDDLAFHQPDLTGKCFHQRRFAGAIGAEKAKDFASPEGDIDALDDRSAAIAGDDIFGVKDGRVVGDFSHGDKLLWRAPTGR